MMAEDGMISVPPHRLVTVVSTVTIVVRKQSSYVTQCRD
jgi:hypothetical protein